MPIKTDLEQLGTSKLTAIKRVVQVERRLKRDSSELTENYKSFMNEYQRLGNMNSYKQQHK